MKHKFFWLIVVVAVAAGFYFYQGKPESKKADDVTKQNQVNDNDDDNNDTRAADTLEGTLRVSNDKKRGNVMLELADSDRVIYMTTSRDFSSLYNKEVVVSIDGDMSGFKLLDIKAK